MMTHRSTAATPAAARAAAKLAFGPGTAEAIRVRNRTGRWKSRIGHPCSSAAFLSSLSGFTATGFPTACRSGRSVTESEYANDFVRSIPDRSAIALTASALPSP